MLNCFLQNCLFCIGCFSIGKHSSIFCSNSLIYNDLCMEIARKIGCFFVLNSPFGELRERENAIKQPKFSVLRFPGTRRLCSKSIDFSLFKWRKNKSSRIFAQIKTPRSSCPLLFYLNTFVLNQP